MTDLPDAFESLAGICKFIAAPQIDEDFYKSHYNAIEMANSFIRVLAGNYPPLEDAFRKSLPLPTHEGGKLINDAFQVINITEEKANWLDSQMTVVLKQLLPVVRSQDLPEMLNFAKHSIEGAFE